MLEDMKRLGATDSAEERTKVIETAPSHFKCKNCFSVFLRGLFLVYGNITDPNKRYHLELSFPTENERDASEKALLGGGIVMHKATRRGRHLLYVKGSADIEDFFTVIGASNITFDLMNVKIVKEVRGQANRQMNCDMANIRKSLSASQKYIDVINEMQKNGTIVRLPKDLRETAELRCENTQASLTDLGLKHNPPVSKSCVKHRLDKIIEIAESIGKE